MLNIIGRKCQLCRDEFVLMEFGDGLSSLERARAMIEFEQDFLSHQSGCIKEATERLVEEAESIAKGK